ncbi:type I-C CRISPR-associated protein Cas7/Csd2 [Clostridium sp. AF15-17LB]|nr:type I-C CRISPR-associated protein Cas7/Csd2 [Clostridium sp. AF15-17LB]
MSSLKGKIDFVMVVSATNANPNGDPLNGNRPRENYEGYGEISDVCIKRKLRNRFQDLGEKVFVQSDDRSDDGFTSLKDRADGCEELAAEIKKGKRANKETCAEIACKEWLDVRAFGQVFAFKGSDVSLGIRGPVSIHQAVSCSPVDIISTQITKSVNSEPGKDSKASDTMGMKHRIGFGLYIIKGSVNVQLAEKTGFSQEDAELLKESLKTLFENDASSARPEGSMEVCDLYWWQHADKTPVVSSAKVHRSVKVKALNKRPKAYEDYKITLNPIEGCVKAEEYHLV